MIGLVITTHGNLGDALLRSLNIILGEQPQVASLSLQVEDDIEQASNKLGEAMEQVDVGDGILILTDMLGGTPSNLSLAMLSNPKVEVISGVNLPMILKATQSREKLNLAETAAVVKEHARSSIVLAREVLDESAKSPRKK